MNIALAMLFTTDGFYPKDEFGNSLLSFSTFSSCFPILTFLLSLSAASIGTSKFFLCGPIQFLPKSRLFDGLLSIPFLTLCLLNCMFGMRTVCIESAFFSSYRYENETTWHVDSKGIDPVISPEMRLPVYFAPCLISFLVNALRLWWTTKGLGKYFIKYPQFLLAPCFTPFLFEGCGKDTSQGHCKIQIWKFGSIMNALYIGIFPQCILLYMDYYKGVHSWKFIGNKLWEEEEKPVFEINDALFKHPLGNSIFAITSGVFYLILIILFFGNYCTHFLNYSDPILDIAFANCSVTYTKEQKNTSKIHESKGLIQMTHMKADLDEKGHTNLCENEPDEMKSKVLQQVSIRIISHAH